MMVESKEPCCVDGVTYIYTSLRARHGVASLGQQPFRLFSLRGIFAEEYAESCGAKP